MANASAGAVTDVASAGAGAATGIATASAGMASDAAGLVGKGFEIHRNTCDFMSSVGRDALLRAVECIQRNPPKLGIIRLDYEYPYAPGDVDCPESFSYPTVYRAVPGFTFEMCQSGEMTLEVSENFDRAVSFLVEQQGCKVITGDCGFMMYWQRRVREWSAEHVTRASKRGEHAVSPLVAMSSLCQLPSVQSLFHKGAKIAIFTANSITLQPMRQLLNEECGLDVEDNDKFIVVGCQDVPGFEAVENGEKVDTDEVEPGMVALAKQTLAEHPEVKAFLFECTELPPYSDAVRVETGVPVYDAITCCDHFMSGLMDNKRFNVKSWTTKVLGQIGLADKKVLGQMGLADNGFSNRLSTNLDASEKAQLVSRRPNMALVGQHHIV